MKSEFLSSVDSLEANEVIENKIEEQIADNTDNINNQDGNKAIKEEEKVPQEHGYIIVANPDKDLIMRNDGINISKYDTSEKPNNTGLNNIKDPSKNKIKFSEPSADDRGIFKSNKSLGIDHPVTLGDEEEIEIIKKEIKSLTKSMSKNPEDAEDPEHPEQPDMNENVEHDFASLYSGKEKSFLANITDGSIILPNRRAFKRNSVYEDESQILKKLIHSSSKSVLKLNFDVDNGEGKGTSFLGNLFNKAGVVDTLQVMGVAAASFLVSYIVFNKIK
jgi:hypothetical protein